MLLRLYAGFYLESCCKFTDFMYFECQIHNFNISIYSHKTKQAKTDQPLDSKSLDENSMDTMDLYRLFERQESAEERRQKEEQERSEVEHDIGQIVDSEGYFGTKEEAADVAAFLG